MKKLYYQLILDKSGSMNPIWEQTISSFNEQISELKAIERDFPDQPLSVSLTLFNNNVTEVYSDKSPGSLSPLKLQEYKPEGTTSLYDAIGSSVQKLSAKISAELEKEESEVIVVIITDGHENASKLFSHEKISGLIKELESTKLWKFNYLGATLDAVGVANSLNITFDNSINVSGVSSKAIFELVTDSIHSYIESKGSDKDAEFKIKSKK
ncbi:MAG: VWA domain-containing protein [Ignavibacteriaceae bacterium]|nr:VWA domain-containing protein [Ignavibacteriaceae bacterium]